MCELFVFVSDHGYLFLSILGEVFVDAASSFFSDVSGAVTGYKRARFERNIKTYTEELAQRIGEIRTNLESKTNEQKQKIDLLIKILIYD